MLLDGDSEAHVNAKSYNNRGDKRPGREGPLQTVQ